MKIKNQKEMKRNLEVVINHTEQLTECFSVDGQLILEMSERMNELKDPAIEFFMEAMKDRKAQPMQIVKSLHDSEDIADGMDLALIAFLIGQALIVSNDRFAAMVFKRVLKTEGNTTSEMVIELGEDFKRDLENNDFPSEERSGLHAIASMLTIGMLVTLSNKDKEKLMALLQREDPMIQLMSMLGELGKQKDL